VRVFFPYTRRTRVIPAAELDDFLLQHEVTCINLVPKSET